jgi:hypothetical protein
VSHILSILRDEVARAMTLMGVDRLEDLDGSHLLAAQSVVPDDAAGGRLAAPFDRSPVGRDR